MLRGLVAPLVVTGGLLTGCSDDPERDEPDPEPSAAPVYAAYLEGDSTYHRPDGTTVSLPERYLDAKTLGSTIVATQYFEENWRISVIDGESLEVVQTYTTQGPMVVSDTGDLAALVGDNGKLRLLSDSGVRVIGFVDRYLDPVAVVGGAACAEGPDVERQPGAEPTAAPTGSPSDGPTGTVAPIEPEETTDTDQPCLVYVQNFGGGAVRSYDVAGTVALVREPTRYISDATDAGLVAVTDRGTGAESPRCDVVYSIRADQVLVQDKDLTDGCGLQLTQIADDGSHVLAVEPDVSPFDSAFVAIIDVATSEETARIEPPKGGFVAGARWTDDDTAAVLVYDGSGWVISTLDADGTQTPVAGPVKDDDSSSSRELRLGD